MRTVDPQAYAKVRRRILNAAREVFASKGYHGASMNSVAQQAGLTKAALYHYFISKQEILGALHEEIWGGVEGRIKELPPLVDLRQALQVLGQSYIELFESPAVSQLMRIVISTGQLEPGLLKATETLLRPKMMQAITGLLEPFLPEDMLREDVTVYGLQFFGALFYYVFVLTQFCTDQTEQPSQEDYLARLVDTFAAQARPVRGK